MNRLALNAKKFLFKKIFCTILATEQDLPEPVLPNIDKWFEKKSLISMNKPLGLFVLT